MARKVPASPAWADAELDQLLDRASPPAMPPGLAARIVAQATALPQFAAEPVAEAAPVTLRETAQVTPFAAPEPPAPVASRKRFAVGGFAAIAATVAAVVLMGQPGRSPAPQGAPAVMAQQQPAAAPLSASDETTELAAITQPAAQLAEGPATRPNPAGAGAAVKVAEAPSSASTSQTVAPQAQLAATAEPASRESAGPTSDPSPRPVPPRGLMGPPAPQQGWGFSGGAPGGSLPGGQALPSQTTGSAPPPPPPSGN